MLERRHRLTTSAGFSAATRRGRRAGTQTLVVHLARGTAGPGDPQVGFVVSRAVGNAVVRTRVKRRLRHLVRERLAGLAPSTVLVVRALPPAADASSAVLGRDLDGALARVGITGAGPLVGPVVGASEVGS